MNTAFKQTIIAACFIASPFISGAQQGSWQVGGHAGVNISKLCCGSMTINEDYEFNAGPAFGLTGAYGLNNYLSLAAELNYTTMGGKRDGMQAISGTGSNALYANFDNKIKLNYLELPVMVRATLGTGNFKYYANVGIFGAYLLNANQESSGSSLLYKDENGTQLYDYNGSQKMSFDKDVDIKDKVKDFNFGLVGGLGAGYLFGKHGIWLDGRYTYGIPNILDNTDVNGENSTGSIMATIGYTYTLR